MKDVKKIQTIVPISIDDYWSCDTDKKAEQIILLHEKYGYEIFMLAIPSHVGSNYEYPSKESWLEYANKFSEIKRKLAPYGLIFGWWIGETITGGLSDEIGHMVNADGITVENRECTLDSVFIKRFSEDIAAFSKLAKPAFIMLEDDFYIGGGCFCDKHLNEFAKIAGRYYSREELKALAESKSDIKTLKMWREFSNNTLISLAKTVRNELDRESPEIPIGTMRPGCGGCDDGNTERLISTLAGENNIPFSRINGCFYCGVDEYDMPFHLYTALAAKQEIKCDFKAIYEADYYPHTRFFHSAAQMRAMLGIIFSYGFDCAQYFAAPYTSTDRMLEEPAYSEMYTGELKRFDEVKRIAQNSSLCGAELPYSVFYHTLPGEGTEQQWLQCLGLFGIPYTTEKSSVACWDSVMAKYSDDSTVKEYLSKGLLLDGEAAKILCDRGYGEYLGAEFTGYLNGNGEFNQGSQEVICEKLCTPERAMPNARHWCSTGNGHNRKIIPNAAECEIVSELYNVKGEFISVAMTRYENSLGGRVVIMGLTLRGNRSQSLLNYARQRIIQDMIKWCGGEYAYVRHTPMVNCTMNEANDENDGFIGMLTLVSLCPDDLVDVNIYLPEKWRLAKSFLSLKASGEWEPLDYVLTDDGIKLTEALRHDYPLYILAEKATEA